jgi:hypothetical protein
MTMGLLELNGQQGVIFRIEEDSAASAGDFCTRSEGK